MYTLRLTPILDSGNNNRVELLVQNSDGYCSGATSPFGFQITAREQEDWRWYLEDFLQYPLDPAPKIAARVEKRLADIGEDLFRSVFQSSEEVRTLWASIHPRLTETRVEVITDTTEATHIPWELMRDPASKKPLAVSSRTFIRAQSRPVQSSSAPLFYSNKVRILLVICRPNREDDVPFRSVAMQILRSLEEDAHERFQLDVLRPPTFEGLRTALGRACDGGHPYHIVHFDGHGIHEDLLAITSGAPPKSKRGYVLFENSAYQDNCEPIHGQKLGEVLAKAGTGVLVVNACRSARDTPLPAPSEQPSVIDAQVHAFGSLAQEVANAGVAAVVAMRYNIYVVTAAQFVADLYTGLAQGQTFGEAVTLSRRRLYDQPEREIAYSQRSLQDWIVPVAYGDTPTAMFQTAQLNETLCIESVAEPSIRKPVLDGLVPNQPDAGFFGRDGILLTLDRLFDTHSIVMLHAFAGSGKTSTAVEFARWYAQTGGIHGAVLFTSFERYCPLARVLDQIGQVLDGPLRQLGVNWLTLTSDDERRRQALQALKQSSVLWIWDNVEPVAGFPVGTLSQWNTDEQRELVSFLYEAGLAGTKFLLTSRRDEQNWLGDFTVRAKLPPMLMQDRVQLARSLAKQHAKQFTDVAVWLPLLEFSQGNPLSITVLVRFALRKGLSTKAQINNMITQLSVGEITFEDEESEGRTKSLGASLHYGFEHAFKVDERKYLALLHLFQSVADVNVLWAMGSSSNTRQLPELKNLSLDAGLDLLDRAAEIGLLSPLGDYRYAIHPAVPWFLKRLFEKYYPTPTDKAEELGARAAHSFAFATAAFGSLLSRQTNEGSAAATHYLSLQEGNLLRALQIAERYRLSDVASMVSEPLYSLYRHYGRFNEWERMADRLTAMSTNPQTGLPLLGWEELWVHASELQVLLAKEKRLLSKAEKIQLQRLNWLQRVAEPALVIPSEELNDKQRTDIQYLAITVHTMAQIKREKDSPECIGLYERAIALSERIGDNKIIAMCAFNLGNAYSSLKSQLDLERAEQWYHQSLKSQPKSDTHSMGLCYGELGNIALKRLIEPDQKPKAKALQMYNDAVGNYLRALALVAPDDVSNRVVAYNGLGILLTLNGDSEGALKYYWEALQLADAAGQHFSAGQFRSNIAANLFVANRFGDALEYAQSAARDFERAGENAEPKFLETLEFIKTIEQSILDGGHNAGG